VRIDLRRMGIGLEDLGETISWPEAFDLINRLQVEMGTHTHASVHGWDFPATYGELLQQRLTQRVFDFLRGKDDDRVDVPVPWTAGPIASDEELKAADAALERRSAIR